MRAARSWPNRKRVFRRQYTMIAAYIHERQIFFLTPFSVHRRCPQLVISRHPEYARKFTCNNIQDERQLLLGITNIACKYQPVILMIKELRQGSPVLCM